MFRARATWVRFAKPLFNSKPRPFCTNNNNNNKTTKPTSNNSISVSENNAVESNVSNDYNQAYKQLDKLDFVTAAKMLFTDPPKKKKFGYCFAFFGISCRSYCFWVLLGFKLLFGISSNTFASFVFWYLWIAKAMEFRNGDSKLDK